ncbi:MAG TPA: hypothetical protein VGI50_06940 [Solirubrobacteraceae bacterium]|jgi:hypothetical protein
MSQPIPREVSFTGVRVTLDSHKSFDVQPTDREVSDVDVPVV